MKTITTSEQIRIELVRKGITQAELAESLNLTPGAISYKIRDNIWKPVEIFYMKNKLGFDLE